MRFTESFDFLFRRVRPDENAPREEGIITRMRGLLLLLLLLLVFRLRCLRSAGRFLFRCGLTKAGFYYLRRIYIYMYSWSILSELANVFFYGLYIIVVFFLNG